MRPINSLLSGGLPVRPTGGSGRRIGQETLDEVMGNAFVKPRPLLAPPVPPIRSKGSSPKTSTQGIASGSESNIGDFLESYAKKGDSSNLMEQAVRIDKEKRALIMLEHNTAGRHSERHVLHNELQNYGHRDAIEAQKLYDKQVLEDKAALEEARSLYAAGNKAEKKQRSDALERVRGLEKAGMEDGSISGLLNRRNEIMNDAIGSIEGYSRQDKIALNRLSTGTNYERPLTELETAEITELTNAINKIGLKDDNFFKKMSGGYDEAAHMNTNTTVASEAMRGGTSGAGFSGYYEPSRGVAPGGSSLDLMESNSSLGLASSILGGAAVGGVANYAMGGDFSEGAMMGGLAGGAIKIGATAIQQNQVGIERFLQRTALGEAGQGMNRMEAAEAIRGMKTAPEGAGLMQRGAFGLLKSEAPSLGMQSRYMVMSGSALSGVAFTGRRNDKRRGFNSHRGNRI